MTRLPIESSVGLKEEEVICLGCNDAHARPGELYCESCHLIPAMWLNDDEHDAYPWTLCPRCGYAHSGLLPHPELCPSCYRTMVEAGELV